MSLTVKQVTVLSATYLVVGDVFEWTDGTDWVVADPDTANTGMSPPVGFLCAFNLQTKKYGVFNPTSYSVPKVTSPVVVSL